MNVETIDDRHALAALAGPWNELLSDSPADNIFLTWEWIGAWLETLGESVEPLAVVVRDPDGRLCGLLPTYRTRFRLLRGVPFRGLRILGDGVSGGEYGNVITRREHAGEAAGALFEHIAKRTPRWDVLWMPNTGPTSEPSDSLLQAAGPLGLLSRTRPAEFAAIALPESFEGYLQSLPQKVRYQMRRGMERAEGEHGAVLSQCRSEAELANSLAELRELHEGRWSLRGERGAFADARKRAFYERMARAMLRRGWLRLDFLRVDGRAVAGQIGFAYHGVFYELQRGFDPEFPKIPAGVGAALRCTVIRRCIEEGIRRYDFLGECTEDKLRAGAVRSEGRDVMLIRPGLRGAILSRLPVWPTGRYLVESPRRRGHEPPSPAPPREAEAVTAAA